MWITIGKVALSLAKWAFANQGEIVTAVEGVVQLVEQAKGATSAAHTPQAK